MKHDHCNNQNGQLLGLSPASLCHDDKNETNVRYVVRDVTYQGLFLYFYVRRHERQEALKCLVKWRLRG